MSINKIYKSAYNKILKTRRLLRKNSAEDILRYAAAKGKSTDPFFNVSNSTAEETANTTIEDLFETIFSNSGEVLNNNEIHAELKKIAANNPNIQNEIAVIYKHEKVPTGLKTEGQGGKVKDHDLSSYLGGLPFFDNNFFNINPPNPSRFSNPSISIYKIRSKVKSIRNTEETSYVPVFANMVPPIEMSRCVPYLNVVIVDDSDDNDKISLSKFLVGKNRFKNDGFAQGLSNVTLVQQNDAVFQTQNQISFNKDGVNKPQTISGMELFQSTQALVNADINRFSSSYEKIIDPFRPFMSIENFSVQDFLVGYKLLSASKGTMSLKLYDRSRMSEISKLIGAKYLSSLSLIIEYGWSHPEGGIISRNPFGQFLNSLKRREIFKISGNTLTINDDGTVNINLDLFSIPARLMEKTMIGAEYITIEELNEYIDFIKKKVKSSKMEKEDRKQLNEFKIEKNAFSRRTNDLIKISSLGPGFFEAFDNFMRINNTQTAIIFNKALELIKAINTVLENKDDNKSEADNQEVFSESRKLGTTESSSIEYYKKLTAFCEKGDSLIGRAGLAKSNPIGPTLVVRRIKKVDENFLSNDNANVVIPDDSDNPETENVLVSKYMTLGKLLTYCYFLPISNKRIYDEIQVYFHRANQSAGAFYGVSLGDVFIDTQRFLQAVNDRMVTTKNAMLSPDELLGIVASILANDQENIEIGYGVDSINSGLGAFEEGEAREAEKEKRVKNRNIRLKNLYQEKNTEDDPTEHRFMNIDLKVKLDIQDYNDSSGIHRKIAKFHVYDKKSEQYSSSRILLEGISDARTNFILNTIKNNPNSSKKIISGINDLVKKNQANKGSFKKIDGEDFWKGAPIKALGEGGWVYNLAKNFLANDIDQIIKGEVPTIEFGANSSTIENISLSSNAGGLANEIQLYRYVNRKENPQDNNTQRNSERTFINPGKVTIKMLGCPLISIGQEFYITAGTKTSMDSIYHVESVNHTVSEGVFSTDVTLSFAGGAAYTHENITKNIIEALLLTQQFSGLDTISAAEKEEQIAVQRAKREESILIRKEGMKKLLDAKEKADAKKRENGETPSVLPFVETSPDFDED